ncbi:dTDP-4-dehydrorhamnose reductase [Alkalicoccobacillus gibsonii]|uniref:dTDP-4-dehydrorhamnose reductase n=1 Tax=Alkalicoccobacillus gibsonii TaxID=79881 RepID=UPI001932B754|nr:dTDP-4-dehydrorhamnose reductase [Alkalicoccobacillus gibsonii]MBM0065903.1 dTDP-4-dehydrorhamnose reductase [Alkalicoccobacillus gibsonii]
MSKKVLITGAGGQLGNDLVKQFAEQGYEVFGLNREELDITNQEKVKEVFTEIKPDIVIHSAAYTAVDNAENDQESAFLINAIGSRNIAIEADCCGSKLVYVSTDYVFNGEAREPINEFEAISPLGIYGRSKLAGEQYVKDLSNKFFIVRTSWVFGLNGNNFVKTMLKLSEQKDELGVVSDQVGSPTYTVDLAHVINELVKTEKYGTYHVANNGSCSWYEFAKEIFKLSNKSVKVNPLTSEEFPRPAKRPAYSVFDQMNLRLNNIKEMPHWKDALKRFLQEYSTTE